MTDTGGAVRVTTPVEAFGLLANDQRMAILEALWAERDPMPFSTLREEAGIRDSGQFNYHLGKLRGLYVRETEEGYTLTRPGRRVLTAVLTGDLLDRPEMEPTRVDWPCPRCGAAVELRYGDGMLRVLCTECPGFFQGEAQTRRERRENPLGTITVLPVPAAGVKGRTPMEVLDASVGWLTHHIRMWLSGMCPECTGPITPEITVCPSHATGDDLCQACNNHYVGIVDATCETCGDGITSLLAGAAWRHPTVLAFFADHGYDLTQPDAKSYRVAKIFEETVRSREPLDFELRWTLDDEVLTVRLDDDLDFIEVTRTDI